MSLVASEPEVVGGRQLSRWDLDELLANAALLIEAAMDSDAINGGLIEPRIYLRTNGEYTTLVFGERDGDKVFFGAGMVRARVAYLIGRSVAAGVLRVQGDGKVYRGSQQRARPCVCPISC